MLKGIKVAKRVKSDGRFCIICVFRIAFTLATLRSLKLFKGLLNHSVKISNSTVCNVRMSDEWYFEMD